VINGSFDKELAPNWTSQLDANRDIVRSPMRLSYETQDTRDGRPGAARVTYEDDPPLFESASHNAGLVVELREAVPAGSWLKVGFYAKALSSPVLLEVMKTWGGSSPAFVSISNVWRHHEVFIRTEQSTPAVIFTLTADTRPLQIVSLGSYLIDDVTVSVVDAPPDARCGPTDSQVCELSATSCGGADGLGPCTPACAGTDHCGRAALDLISARPAGAYSVAHRLLPLYRGPALRVRRASDGEEANIGFDDQNHVDTSVLSEFCGDVDCTVATLFDQSGHARDLIQPAPLHQPTIYEGRTRAVTSADGQPVLPIRDPERSLVRSDTGLTATGGMTVAYVGRLAPDASAASNAIQVGPFRQGELAGYGVVFGYDAAGDWLSFGTGSTHWRASVGTKLHLSVLQAGTPSEIGRAAVRIDGSDAQQLSGGGATDGFELIDGGSLTLGWHGQAGAELQSLVLWGSSLAREDLVIAELGLSFVSDGCPDDSAKLAPGKCGCGFEEADPCVTGGPLAPIGDCTSDADCPQGFSCDNAAGNAQGSCTGAVETFQGAALGMVHWNNGPQFNSCAMNAVPNELAAMADVAYTQISYNQREGEDLPPDGARTPKVGAFGGDCSLTGIVLSAPTNHVQSLVRMPGSPGERWMAASISAELPIIPGGVLFVELGQVGGNEGEPFRQGRNDNRVLNRTQAFYALNALHPGGMQMLGRTLVVPVEQDLTTGRGALYFIDASDPMGKSVDEAIIQKIDISNLAYPEGTRVPSAPSAAAVMQLASGGYLLAMNAGSNANPNPVWLYLTRDTSIGPNTKWHFHNQVDIPSAPGAENMNFVTECDGTSYLLVTGNHQGGSVGENGIFNNVNIHKLVKDGDKLSLALLGNRQAFLEDGYGDFRASATFYVSPHGELALYANARSTVCRDDNFKFAEYLVPEFCGLGGCPN
jgi:hypothetical protein